MTREPKDVLAEWDELKASLLPDDDDTPSLMQELAEALRQALAENEHLERQRGEYRNHSHDLIIERGQLRGELEAYKRVAEALRSQHPYNDDLHKDVVNALATLEVWKESDVSGLRLENKYLREQLEAYKTFAKMADEFAFQAEQHADCRKEAFALQDRYTSLSKEKP